MKKLCFVLALLFVLSFVSCTEAERVSHNLSKQADNFNIVRQLTVINCIEGDVLFQMTGKLSIEVDEVENQLEVTVDNGDGSYSKHFVGLGTHIAYTCEDLNLGANEVSNYKYTLVFNPKMWLPPIEIEVVE